MPEGMEGLDALWQSDVAILQTYSNMRRPGQKVVLKLLPYPMNSFEPVIPE